MTNSMNNLVQDLDLEIKKHFQLLHVDYVTNLQIAYDVENRDLHAILSYLKSLGWIQLSIVTCVDWIEEGKLQLVYVLFNWEKPVRIQIRTKINRENPKFPTIMNIYPGAKYYERDVHEQFGIEFEGNPDSLKQLFLENWDDIPPLRKDFNPKAYSDKKYGKRTYTKDFNTKDGEES